MHFFPFPAALGVFGELRVRVSGRQEGCVGGLLGWETPRSLQLSNLPTTKHTHTLVWLVVTVAAILGVCVPVCAFV